MLRTIAYAAVVLCLWPAVASAAEWNVGVARVVITPGQPVWLSGYGARNKPAQGKVHDLYAKALVFESQGTRLALVTCDLGSVSSLITDPVAEAVEKQFGLPRRHLVINVSHTHCAPEVAAERPVFHDLAPEEEAKLAGYIAEELRPKLITLVGEALRDLKPSVLKLSSSTAAFASNRRLKTPEGFVNAPNEQGVTDREVPVLQVLGEDNRLRAILFGYACHNTTLEFYEFSGDYAGFAQYDIEAAHPGVTALFMMGCGGDQNPYPRHGDQRLVHARAHGRELAQAVDKALKAEARIIHGPLRVAQETVDLELEPLPPRADLERDAAGPPGLPRRKATYLLGQLKERGKIDLTQPCPLLVAKFGNDLLYVAISGETVVDYSLFCKAEFAGAAHVWVAGYCNDVFAYLPSRRVLLEGGYEGRTGIIHQLTPTPFLPSVEDRVMGGVRRLVQRVSE